MVINEGLLEYQVLLIYLSDFHGGTVGGEYAKPQNHRTTEPGYDKAMIFI